MATARILFVDDDAGIRETLPRILEMHGYEVITAASIPEALNAITSQRFDVLITDLNMGHAADGFTVVHAMRRTNPTCINFILTGFPALESALQALRSQVDDYFTKPSNIPLLLNRIEQRLQNRSVPPVQAKERLAQIVREHLEEIVERSQEAMKADPDLAQLPLSDTAWLDPLRASIRDVADHMATNLPNDGSELLLRSARWRGEVYHRQRFPLDFMLQNERVITQVIHNIIYEHLMVLDLSYLLLDLGKLDDALLLQLKESISAYLGAERSKPFEHS